MLKKILKLICTFLIPSAAWGQEYIFEFSPAPNESELHNVNVRSLPSTDYLLSTDERELFFEPKFQIVFGSGEWIIQKTDGLTEIETFLRTMHISYQRISLVALVL